MGTKYTTPWTPGTAFTNIPGFRWTPPRENALHMGVYLHIDFALKSTAKNGSVRLRAVREPWRGKPIDYTAYQDFVLPWNGTDDGEFLISHSWFEWTDAGRPIHWEIDRSPDFNKFVITTRYAKWYLER